MQSLLKNKNPLPTYQAATDRGEFSQRTPPRHLLAIVQASALQVDEIALFHALISTGAVDLLVMFPRSRGSNLYLCK